MQKLKNHGKRINSALDNDEIITGFVKSRTKGGLIVDIMGVEAFLPGSQIDIKPIRDYDIYVGKTMEFKVVKINHEFKNVVVSHKVLIEDDLENQKTEIVAKLEKGQVLKVPLKTLPTLVYLLTLVVLTVYCTLQIFHGAVSSIRAKFWHWIKRSTLLCLILMMRKNVSPLA